MKRAYLVLLVYALLIAYLSLRQGGGAVLAPWDKLGHLLAYGLFAVLGYLASQSRPGFLALCLCIVLYSGLLELGQSVTPGRFMSLADLLANGLGVALGGVASHRLLRKW